MTAPARGLSPALRLPPPRLIPAKAAVFLDIDGTLLELAATPDQVEVHHEVKTLLPALSQRLNGALALITGRTLADADRLFPGMALPVAGLHGLVRRTPEGHVHSPPPLPDIGQLRGELATFVARHGGLLLEDKGSSLAVHYRKAPRLAPHVYRIVRKRVANAHASWRLQPGKAMVEIGPVGRDKGTAICEFMTERPFHGRTPVFVGDDRTDEHGFAAVASMGGWGVKVGRGPTHAAYRLRDVMAVRLWLASALAVA